MKLLSAIGLSVLGLVVVAALCVFFHLLDFGMFSAFAPRYEEVRRQTFEQSQSHVEGMTRELENIRTDYLDPSKTPEQRAALRATALEQFSVFPTDELPPDLQSFYNSIRK